MGLEHLGQTSISFDKFYGGFLFDDAALLTGRSSGSRVSLDQIQPLDQGRVLFFENLEDLTLSPFLLSRE